MSVTGESAHEVCTPPEVDRITEPNPALVEQAQSKLERFRTQYHALKGHFV
jgi:hypothetical protein